MREFYPKAGQAKGIQIDIDGRLLSLRYPMDVNLKGDAKQTLQALIPLHPAQRRSRVAGKDHRQCEGMVEGRRRSRPYGRQQRAAQSRTRILGTEPQAARSMHYLRRQRHDRQLVCARPENSPRHDGQRQRQSRVDGRGRSLCRGREILLPRPRAASPSPATGPCR